MASVHPQRGLTAHLISLLTDRLDPENNEQGMVVKTRAPYWEVLSVSLRGFHSTSVTDNTVDSVCECSWYDANIQG